MPADLVQVEVTGEEIVLIRLAEGVGFVAGEPAGSGRAHVQEGRHDFRARPFVSGLEDRVVDLAVDAAVDRVDQTVALAAAGMHEERGGEDRLSARREDHVDGVIHAAGHHRLDSGAIGPARKMWAALVTNGGLPGRS